MNTLFWIAQILLAGTFLFTGAGKLLAYEKLVRVVEKRSKGGKIGMSRSQAGIVGVLEIAGAVGVILPFDLWPPDMLMVVAGIYHLRRQESAVPSVVLFLLALFVIVGRWPR
jgi:hypothetical protein